MNVLVGNRLSPTRTWARWSRRSAPEDEPELPHATAVNAVNATSAVARATRDLTVAVRTTLCILSPFVDHAVAEALLLPLPPAVSRRAPATRADRLILVAALRGSCATNSTVFGALYDASRSLAKAMTSLSESVAASGIRSTTACTRLPQSGSDRPMTTASAMPGCSESALSTSAGKTFAPPVMIMSTRRSAR